MTTKTMTAETFLAIKAGPEIERRRLAGRKRRSLVLTDDAARHPFRAALPPHVTSVDVDEEEPVNFWHLTRDDVRGFATTYFAVFAAVLVFIL